MASIKESVVYNVEMENKDFLSGTKANEKAVDGMTKTIGKSKTAFLAVGAGAAGAAAGIVKMADLASDLNEAMNVVNSTLGDSADEVIAWSEDSVQAMGLSQTQALKTAGVYGAMATSLGLTDSQAADMAMTLTGLSADLASFYNVSQDVAGGALKGIFTGETESLKQFGIMIDEATLKQYGYSSSMSQTEKIMIRYQAVMDQTKDVQGDFARTSDGLANQSRILKEQMIQLATIIGQKLVPYVEAAAHAFNDGLTVAIGLLSGKTDEFTPKQQEIADNFEKWIPIILTVVKVVGVMVAIWVTFNVVTGIAAVVMGIISTALGIWELATLAMAAAQVILDLSLLPIIAIIFLVVAAIIIIIAVILNWAKIVAFMGLVWEKFKELLANTWTFIWEDIFMPIVEFIDKYFVRPFVFAIKVVIAAWEYWVDLVHKIMNWAWNNIYIPVGNFLDKYFVQPFKRSINTVIELSKGFANLIKSIFEWLWQNVYVPIEKFLLNLFIKPFKKAIDTVIGIWDNFQNAIAEGWSRITGFFSNGVNAVINGLNRIPFVNIPNVGQSISINGVNPQALQNAGVVTNNYNFKVRPQDTGSYRQAYRSGKAMVMTNGGTL